METRADVHIHPIHVFFANYPDFDYNPDAPFFEEFKRLETELHWERKKREAAREGLRNAMVQEFNAMYGTSAEDLASWQLLCSALGMKVVPNDVKSCQRKVKATHVNIVDFIEAPLSGKPIRTFNTELELSKYTRETKKFFPRYDVNAGSLLRSLLRQIMNPYARRASVAKSGLKAQAKEAIVPAL
ncbi:hypothetical protein BD414DRAFT_474009 [Trametes punicea]|nr:hypothetical protein BD414DRAFT_474009 [Trametes punicea]